MWEKIPPDNPFGSLDALLEAAIGVSLAAARAKFAQEIAKDPPILRDVGRPWPKKSDTIVSAVDDVVPDDPVVPIDDNDDVGYIDDVADAPAPEPAKPKRSSKSNSGNTRVKSLGKNQGREYYAAKIAKDFPDVQKKMEDGHYKSVNQAAEAAGLRPVYKSIGIGYMKDDDVLEANPELTARALKRHYSGEKLAELIRRLQEDDPD